MRNRAFRTLTAILSMMLLTNVPAQAGPVVVSQVVQVLDSYQNPPKIKLRGVSQNSTQVTSRVKSSLLPATANDSAGYDSIVISDTSIAAEWGDSSLLSGVAFSNDPKKTVDVIDQGDVEGTVCDCGEILIAGGGWPKWPLLLLAGVPLLFIHDCKDCDTPPSVISTPTPVVFNNPTPPSSIPEPASLLLFGTGLAAFGAGLRRRYAKNKLSEQIAATEEK